MNTRRLGVAVAVLGGFLYAVGGSDGQMPLCTGIDLINSTCSRGVRLKNSLTGGKVSTNRR